MDAPYRIHRYADAREVIERAADRIVRSIAEAVDSRGVCALALSGGGTPRSLYQLLSSNPYRMNVDWSHVEFFWGDERPVPFDDEQSNYRMAREALLDPLDVEDRRIHRMQAERDDKDRAAADYEREIADCFSIEPFGPPPSFDVILLGMGDDGHTASLFPYTGALIEEQRWVVANQVPQLSTMRMTMTLPLINQAQLILFLVTGEAKSAALAAVLEGPSDPQRLPSQLIRPTAGELEFYTDAAAAGGLQHTRESFK